MIYNTFPCVRYTSLASSLQTISKRLLTFFYDLVSTLPTSLDADDAMLMMLMPMPMLKPFSMQTVTMTADAVANGFLCLC